MSYPRNFSINKYLDDLASAKPTPGGGSAAALAGCLGAGLLCMVSRFSLGKRFKQTEDKTKKILKSLEHIRRNLKLLIYLDMDAYNLVVASKDLDKETKIKSYEQSKDTALAVCQNCYAALKLAENLTGISNYNLIDDLEAAVYLLESAFNSAVIFLEVNNNAIKAIRRKAVSR